MLQDGNTVQIGELLLTFSSRLVQIQDGDEEQSTVYAAIDVVNQSDPRTCRWSSPRSSCGRCA